jgi:hypothetical protein
MNKKAEQSVIQDGAEIEVSKPAEASETVKEK